MVTNIQVMYFRCSIYSSHKTILVTTELFCTFGPATLIGFMGLWFQAPVSGFGFSLCSEHVEQRAMCFFQSSYVYCIILFAIQRRKWKSLMFKYAVKVSLMLGL